MVTGHQFFTCDCLFTTACSQCTWTISILTIYASFHDTNISSQSYIPRAHTIGPRPLFALSLRERAASELDPLKTLLAASQRKRVGTVQTISSNFESRPVWSRKSLYSAKPRIMLEPVVGILPRRDGSGRLWLSERWRSTNADPDVLHIFEYIASHPRRPV
jgi:hypothetical protein